MPTVCSLVMALLAIFSAAPWWSWSKAWGYLPMASVAVLLMVGVLALVYGPTAEPDSEQS